MRLSFITGKGKAPLVHVKESVIITIGFGEFCQSSGTISALSEYEHMTSE